MPVLAKSSVLWGEFEDHAVAVFAAAAGSAVEVAVAVRGQAVGVVAVCHVESVQHAVVPFAVLLRAEFEDQTAGAVAADAAGSTVQISRFVQYQIATWAESIFLVVGEAVQYSQLPAAVLGRRELEHIAIRIGSGIGRRAVGVARGIHRQAAVGIRAVSMVREAMHQMVRPGAVSVGGQLESDAAVAVRIAAKEGCAVKVAFRIPTERRFGHVLTALLLTEVGVDPAIEARRELADPARAIVAEPAVKIARFVNDQAHDADAPRRPDRVECPLAGPRGQLKHRAILPGAAVQVAFAVDGQRTVDAL